MGKIAGAGLLSHVPTIMLPSDVRHRLNEGNEISLVPGLERLRRERDGKAAQAALTRLSDAARSDANTVPAILECVEAYCTLGEMSGVLREAFGEQEELAAF